MFARLASLASFVAVIAAGNTNAATVVDPALTIDNIITAGSVSQPTCMVFLGTNDILVGEKGTGQVKRIINGVVQGTAVLDLPVVSNSERGLLGMVLDPGFPTSNSVYIYYSRGLADSSTGTNAQDHRVSKFTWNGTTLSGETTLLTLPISGGPNHDGGVIKFGPPTAAPSDQKLYGIIGDLNRNNQPENYSGGTAPDGTAMIFRINPDGSDPVGAQAGPFHAIAGGNEWLERMYAYGIRNSFGLDFDPVTGALWDTENGPGPSNGYDEINRVDSAFNSGWERFMGPSVIQPGPTGLVQFSGVGTYSDPEFSWQTTVAPTGIHFLSGLGLGAGYQFDCFVGDNNNGFLYRFEPNGGRTGFVLSAPLADLVRNDGDTNAEILFGQNFGAITDIETGPDGNLYVLSLFPAQIYRIRAVSAVKNWEFYD